VAWAPEGAAAARLFVGPKSYDLLRQVDAELHVGVSRLLDFGYFEFIAVPLFLIMKWLNQHLHSYGLAIIILTFLIKLIFYPITQRTMVNMRRLQTQMKRVQPRVQHLKEQYARKGRSMKARQEMHEQMMELYRREGINPMAGMTGCLPLLLQIPILWAFYNLLSTAIELRRAPFLYLRDLSAQDPYYITPIIMGATMWIQQRMSGTAMPEPSQRLIMNLMPVFMTYVFLSFPSGLVLYWLVNNILSIGQQYLINRQAETAEATAGRDKAAARRA
jgi:YidC/Oxa1 family membrane protein insertase